jgi:selenide, water dikinase
LVAIGFVDPRKMLSKNGLRIGDALVLTKPLGFGVTTTALKQEKAEEKDVAEVVDWMKRLNRSACQLALEFELRGGTDITGYSLLGHGLEMANASGISLRIDMANVPLVTGARIYAEKEIFPGGAFDNRSYFGRQVEFAESIDEPAQMLLFDPQTSGGLLLGVPPGQLDAFLARAEEIGQPAWRVGKVQAGTGIQVY